MIRHPLSIVPNLSWWGELVLLCSSCGHRLVTGQSYRVQTEYRGTQNISIRQSRAKRGRSSIYLPLSRYQCRKSSMWKVCCHAVKSYWTIRSILSPSEPPMVYPSLRILPYHNSLCSRFDPFALRSYPESISTIAVLALRHTSPIRYHQLMAQSTSRDLGGVDWSLGSRPIDTSAEAPIVSVRCAFRVRNSLLNPTLIRASWVYLLHDTPFTRLSYGFTKISYWRSICHKSFYWSIWCALSQSYKSFEAWICRVD